MIVLLIAALGTLAAGVMAILYGVSYKEFGLGNTMILAGVIGACTGLVLFGLWIATREMRALARHIAAPASAGLHDPSLPELGAPSKTPFPSRPPAREPAIVVAPPAPSEPQPSSFSQTESGNRSAPSDLAPVPVPEPESEQKPKPRRNLLFESSVRKDRDRATSTTTTNGSGAAPPIDTGQRPVFDDPIEQRSTDRADRLQRTRSPSTFPDPQKPAQTDVTVLKSGVVDGMAYSLYSDGSIEAQMPEGMMRFASIEALRAHLDQRT